jgi:hypothetical protein
MVGHIGRDRRVRACVKQGQLERAISSTWAILRDFGCFAGGMWAFVHEENTGKINPWILAMAMALIGGPAWLRFREVLQSTKPPPTASPSPSSESLSSSPSSPTS